MNLQQPPYLLRISEEALALGGMLLPPTHIHLVEAQSTRPVQVERTLAAYLIPYLPDLLMLPHLSGSTERERLTEVLGRHAQFVANLGKWKAAAFALRFHAQPERRAIEVALIARIIAPIGHGFSLGAQMASDVASLLGSFDYPVEPVTTEEDLRTILEPYPDVFIVEIRQHEEVVSMAAGDAYVVYPFRPPITTWIPAFKTLVQQRSPCVVSVYLEPTELHPFERRLFAEAAQVAESLSDWTFEGLAYRDHFADPVAHAVATFYAEYLARFSAPYLLTIQIASPDPTAARNAAQALAAELTETRSFDEATGGAPLPSGFDIVGPEGAADLQAAWRTLSILDLHAWGRTEATEGKERLRYLADAHAASAAFRFPVAMRGGIPGVKTRQPLPSYEMGPKSSTTGVGEIFVGTLADQGGIVSVPVVTLNRHALVAGTTGSGKTTTCMHILSQLWERGVPFLVIEPAKTEYRALLDSPLAENLQVFTLGDEGVSCFRLNPLEILPGVRVETHISYLRACFEAALPTFGVLPSLIEESLHNVFQDKGWSLTDRGQAEERIMPTLGDLYFEVIRVTEGRGYSEKTLQDIRAAASGRIGSLLRGSKGHMLNNRRSIPMQALMTRPSVLELESLNDEEKALVMLFLLTFIREYCRATRTDSRLQHVTLIEEAHRVMGATPHATDREVSADTRAEAVGMFSAALSEMRAFGEGLIIAEQIPGRLAEDALKNTNIKIVHRLPGQDDREALGATMNITPEQGLYLAKLPPGQAALFIEGYEKPTFVLVPNYRRNQGLPERVSDERVKAHMMPAQEEYRKLLLPFDGCRYCVRQCHYRDRVTPLAYETQSARRFRRALWSVEKRRHEGNESVGWQELVRVCREAVEAAGLGKDEHGAYCYFTHLWDYEFTEAMAEQFGVVFGEE